MSSSISYKNNSLFRISKSRYMMQTIFEFVETEHLIKYQRLSKRIYNIIFKDLFRNSDLMKVNLIKYIDEEKYKTHFHFTDDLIVYIAKNSRWEGTRKVPCHFKHIDENFCSVQQTFFM